MLQDGAAATNRDIWEPVGAQTARIGAGRNNSEDNTSGGFTPYPAFTPNPKHDYLQLAALNTDPAATRQAQEQRESARNLEDEQNRAAADVAAAYDAEIALLSGPLNDSNYTDAVEDLKKKKDEAVAAVKSQTSISAVRETRIAQIQAVPANVKSALDAGLLSQSSQMAEFYGDYAKAAKEYAQAKTEYAQTTQRLDKQWSELDEDTAQAKDRIYNPNSTTGKFIPDDQRKDFERRRAEAQAKIDAAGGDRVKAAQARVEVAKVDVEATNVAAANAQRAIEEAVEKAKARGASETEIQEIRAKAQAEARAAQEEQRLAQERLDRASTGLQQEIEAKQKLEAAKGEMLAAKTKLLEAQKAALTAQPNSTDRNDKLAALDTQLAAAKVEAVTLKAQQEILAKEATESQLRADTRTILAQAEVKQARTVKEAQLAGNAGAGKIAAADESYGDESLSDTAPATLALSDKSKEEATQAAAGVTTKLACTTKDVTGPEGAPIAGAKPLQPDGCKKVG